MLKYLRRLQRKKGFTLIELVVVIAIIAILTALILTNLIAGDGSEQINCNANAKVFFSATQLTFTKAQMTERDLVKYETTDKQYIKYDGGVNKIKNAKGNDGYMYVEAYVTQKGMQGIHISDSIQGLLSVARSAEFNDMTALEKYLMNMISSYMSENAEGYYYALVDNNFKVLYTHFCKGRLPLASGSNDDLRNNLMFSGSRIVGNKLMVGTCSDDYINGNDGDYLFGLPSPTEGSFYYGEE